jgi:3-oxoadipate CoA-transferase beta subunit
MGPAAVGGEMDLAIGARETLVMMTLFAKDGSAKLVPSCTYPLTGLACVSRVYTELATFQVGPAGAAVIETWGTSFAELAASLAIPLRRD